MAEKFELEENETAIVINPEKGVRFAMPKMAEDAEVPPHMMITVALVDLIASADERLQELVNAKIDEMEMKALETPEDALPN